MTTELPRHGGDLSFATARYGRPAEGWLDLSTGLNPNPYPLPAFPADSFTRLPQPDALTALEDLARGYYGVPDGADIVAIAGTELAIRLLPTIAPSGNVAIPGPVYRSHVESWTAAGRTILDLDASRDLPANCRIVLVVNPGNPTGRRHHVPELAEHARTLRPRGGFVIVDEAFGDASPQQSAIAMTADLPVIVLRSFGKFFGLPGLRLGFVIGAPKLLARLRSLIGDWPISGPALAAGRAALADDAWTEETRRRIAAGETRLAALLKKTGLGIEGTGGLFVVAAHTRAHEIHCKLAERGVWTRVFSDHAGWLRLGLPHEHQFDRLDRALTRVMDELRDPQRARG